jgi:hypothetical protein
METRDKMTITFTIEVVSFPSPHDNITIGLCNGKEQTVMNVSWDISLITVNFKDRKYKVQGYQGNVSASVEALPENGAFCVDISNKYGSTSFHLYGNITDYPNDSINDGNLSK